MESPTKRVRSNANFIGFAAGAHCLASLAVSLLMTAYVILVQLFVPSAGPALFDSAWLETSAGGLLLNMVLYIAVVFLPYMLMAKLRKFSLKELFGTGRAPAKAYLFTIFACFLISFAASAVAGLMEAGFNACGLTDLAGSEYAYPGSPAAAVLQFLSIAILPPLAEELCFRGYVFKEASRSAGTVCSVLVAAIVFALAHTSFTTIPLALLFGIFAGFLREKYDTILPAVVGHAVINSVYFFVNYVTYFLPAQQVFRINMLVNGISLACSAFAILLFVWGRSGETAFFRPARAGKAAPSVLGYITSLPFVLMMAVLVVKAVLNLQVL